MSLFPKDDKQRKMLPVFKMICGYFPKALREVTRVCVANNVRYNPGKDPADISWARDKSPDQLGSAFRHIFERAVDGTVFEDVPKEVTEATGIEKVYILAEAAWRTLAALELDIEQEEAKKEPSVAVPTGTGVVSQPRYMCCGATTVEHAPTCFRVVSQPRYMCCGATTVEHAPTCFRKNVGI